MTEHPINPPPELIAKWVAEINDNDPVIPVHYHITCLIPFFNMLISPGTPQQFLEQMRIRAPGIHAIVLDTGQTWEADY